MENGSCGVDSLAGYETTSVAGGNLVKSKIPRFQRSQSMRVKGERAPLVASGVGSGDMNHLRGLTSVMNNWKSHNLGLLGPLEGPQVDRCGVRSATPSRPSSLCNKGRRGSTSSATCLKIHSPSEYGSLPPTPVPSPDGDDGDGSVKSFRSFCSTMSLDALTCSGQQPASVPAARRKKFVVHCQSHHHEEEEYLTPTQRKDRLIRQLKAMLIRAKREIDEKDAKILRLTSELIELRLHRTPTLELDATDGGLQVCTQKTDAFSSLNCAFKSPGDSGHFEQNASSNGHLISSSCKDEATNTCSVDGRGSERMTQAELSIAESDFLRKVDIQSAVGRKASGSSAELDMEEIYKREIEELKRQHTNEYQELKEKHNDRVENLLQKLSEANTRYFDLRPKYDRAQEQVRQLEKQIRSIEMELGDQNKRHHQMYLDMYKKGQEAARFEHADEVLEFAHHAPGRVSVPEILRQLQTTESELERVKALYRREIYKQSDCIQRDAEITLKFLKDAIYHFLTNKDSKDHLRAIESIMGYNEVERLQIERNALAGHRRT